MFGGHGASIRTECLSIDEQDNSALGLLTSLQWSISIDKFRVVYEHASGKRLGERPLLQALCELPPIGWRVHKGG